MQATQASREEILDLLLLLARALHLPPYLLPPQQTRCTNPPHPGTEAASVPPRNPAKLGACRRAEHWCQALWGPRQQGGWQDPRGTAQGGKLKEPFSAASRPRDALRGLSCPHAVGPGRTRGHQLTVENGTWGLRHRKHEPPTAQAGGATLCGASSLLTIWTRH